METVFQFTTRKNTQFEKERSKAIKMKDVGRAGTHHWIREAWTLMPQSGLDTKVFCIERLRRKKLVGTAAHKQTLCEGDIEYRIGYYIVGQIGRAKGKWTWGQFCPLIPQGDLETLLQKAKSEDTII